eukprot:SAG31_NODE_37785_length_301_cov_1.024752_1_plen_20_part_01
MAQKVALGVAIFFGLLGIGV